MKQSRYEGQDQTLHALLNKNERKQKMTPYGVEENENKIAVNTLIQGVRRPVKKNSSRTCEACGTLRVGILTHQCSIEHRT